MGFHHRNEAPYAQLLIDCFEASSAEHQQDIELDPLRGCGRDEKNLPQLDVQQAHADVAGPSVLAQLSDSLGQMRGRLMTLQMRLSRDLKY